MAMENFVEAWKGVSKQCIHYFYLKLIPQFICDLEGLRRTTENTANCIQLTRQKRSKEVEDVKDHLNTHLDDLTTEELQKCTPDGQVTTMKTNR